MATQGIVNEVFTKLFRGDPMQAVDLLDKHAPGDPSPIMLALLRHAIQRPRQSQLYYLRLVNLWNRLGRPALKPNPATRPVLFLSDFTNDGFVPLLRLFCGGLGVQADIANSAFDSVEQLALDPAALLAVGPDHVVLLHLSEHWLARYFGNRGLVLRANLKRAEEVLARLTDALLRRGAGQVLIANFPGRAYPMPGGTAISTEAIGWNLAIAELTVGLAARCSDRLHLVDVAEAVAGAGGRAALGRLSYLRSKMAYESAGTVAVARSMAGAVAHVSGKTHRALLSDWDNTLWGGEVAETGSHGVVCGLDSPDGLGYHLIQRFLKDLRASGVLLGGVSRNDPAVTRILDENPDVVLGRADFASLHVGFLPKSQAVTEFSRNVGFGPEFMVFLDDSLFELAEVLYTHPAIDVLPAGPDPDATLRTLSDSGLFEAMYLSTEDLERADAADLLRQQREMQAGYSDLGQFLRDIQIRLDVSGLTDQNQGRVAQMFQKSNQFNLTTRRHGPERLNQFVSEGALLGVFSYEDAFGRQGIISVVNLVPEEDGLRVESWLMSCRVLHRTVEQAVFEWVRNQTAGRPVVGEYIPTAKNGLVRDLYRDLGFKLVTTDMDTGRQIWQWQAGEALAAPEHYVQLRAAA
jgi:FkbH-like protein